MQKCKVIVRNQESKVIKCYVERGFESYMSIKTILESVIKDTQHYVTYFKYDSPDDSYQGIELRYNTSDVSIQVIHCNENEVNEEIEELSQKLIKLL